MMGPVKTFLWVVAGGIALILVGWLVLSLLGTLLKLGFYLIVGVLVVGGGLYLAGKTRRSLGSNQRRQLP
jgi:membrane protein implicated in regulation of membrane protease activity